MLGSGTGDEPWEITTIDHLAALAAYVNTGNGWSTTDKYYILMNDIDLAGWEVNPNDTCG